MTAATFTPTSSLYEANTEDGFCGGDWKSRAHTWQEVRAGRNSLADVRKSDVCK